MSSLLMLIAPQEFDSDLIFIDQVPLRSAFSPSPKPTLPLEVFFYIASFLAQPELVSYLLVCHSLYRCAKQWLYLDVTLRTFQQVKAFTCSLNSNPDLCGSIRTLRLSAGSAAICLSNRFLFPYIREIVYLRDWKDNLWSSRFKPKRFMSSNFKSTLIKITIQGRIELSQLVHIISSIHGLISLSCGAVSLNKTYRTRRNDRRSTLKLLYIGGDSDFNVGWSITYSYSCYITDLAHCIEYRRSKGQHCSCRESSPVSRRKPGEFAAQHAEGREHRWAIQWLLIYIRETKSGMQRTCITSIRPSPSLPSNPIASW